MEPQILAVIFGSQNGDRGASLSLKIPDRMGDEQSCIELL